MVSKYKKQAKAPRAPPAQQETALDAQYPQERARQAAAKVADIMRRSRAHRNPVLWALEREAAEALVLKECLYCGVPSGAGGGPLNGIDRLFPDKGYAQRNKAPCCHRCSRVKGDRPVGEFLDWVQRIANANR